MLEDSHKANKNSIDFSDDNFKKLLDIGYSYRCSKEKQQCTN